MRCSKSVPIPLLDHLIGAGKQGRRYAQTKRVRRLHIDHQFELGGLLDGQLARLGTIEDLINIPGRAAIEIGKICHIGHKPASFDVLSERICARKSGFEREHCQEFCSCVPQAWPADEKSLRLEASYRIERAGIIGGGGLCVDQGDTQRRGSSADALAAWLFPVILVTEKGNPRRRWNDLLEHL